MTDSNWHGTDSEDGFPTSGHPQPRTSGGGCLGLLVAGLFVVCAVALIGSQIGMAVAR